VSFRRKLYKGRKIAERRPSRLPFATLTRAAQTTKMGDYQYGDDIPEGVDPQDVFSRRMHRMGHYHPGMGGMGGRGGMGFGEDDESMASMAATVQKISTVISYIGYGLVAWAVFWFVSKLVQRAPDMARAARRMVDRKRTRFEKAAFTSIAAVVLPIAVAQVGLITGPLLPPLLGWRIYVYGSFVSGASATILGGYAVYRGDRSQATRATVCTVVGLLVLGLLYQATWAAREKGAPKLNDVATVYYKVSNGSALDLCAPAARETDFLMPSVLAIPARHATILRLPLRFAPAIGRRGRR
jgi:hypothetical protein